MIDTLITVLTPAVLVFFIVAWAYRFEPPERFWKPKNGRSRVQVPAKPGTFIELVADDGEVVGIVGLLRIERNFETGLTVVFKDFTHFMTDRRQRDRDNDD